MTQKHNVLIILNGASSSGKTSVAKELVNLLGTECIYTGLDDMLERLRPFGPEDGKVINKIQRNIRILWFQLTDGRLRLFKQLHRDVVSHCQSGRDVVVEIALMDSRALRDAAECFAPLDGLFVGLKPPLDVSEKWEAGRGDRPVGQARKHYDLIHAHGIYDLALDTSRMTPHESAVTILQFLKNTSPCAFQKLINNNSIGQS